MADWNSGYRVDIDYTYGYYPELNPVNMQFAMLLAGLCPPQVQSACELGYGQGVSLNVHAAASGVSWHGTDFNPAHTAFAQELARASGAAAQCHNDSFCDFAEREDLPDFDFIALHGVWTWVSEENQRAILRLIDRKLRVGGVVYIGYNTLPGWAPVLPLRELLVRLADTGTPSGASIETRVKGAVEFAKRLCDTNPSVLGANPAIASFLAALSKHDPRYVAHEYFNLHWRPQSVAEMALQLGSVRLRYGCTARFLDAIDAINLTQDQARMLGEVADPAMREFLRDFLMNRFFRRDYWVKGAQTLTSVERVRRLRAMRVMLLRSPEGIDLKVKGALGEAELLGAVYRPVLDVLAKGQALEISQIEIAVNERGVDFALMIEALTILIGRGLVIPLRSDEDASTAQRACVSLNRHLIARAETADDVAIMASSLTGGGIPLGRIQRWFLAECFDDNPEPERLVEHAWSLLREQKHVLLKDGQLIEGEAENRVELRRLADMFLADELRLLKTLKVV